MKKRYVIGIAAFCIYLSPFLASSHLISWDIMESDLELGARRSQSIDASWKAVSATSNKFSTILFYDESLSQGNYVLYETHNRRSVGYFFRDDGNLADAGVIEGIQGFNYGKGFVVLSVNKANAMRIGRIFEKEDLPEESREVDPDKPFVITLSPDGHLHNGTVIVYDAEGHDIPFNSFIVIECY